MAVAPVQPAPEPSEPAGFHTHDGFFLQLNGGLGAMGSKASQGGESLELSGGGGLFTVALGGSLSPNFVLALDLWAMSVSEPDVKYNGSALPSCGGGVVGPCVKSDSSFGLSGIGVNLTYYFTPSNFYLSAVPSIAKLTTTSSSGTSGTKDGFAFRLAVRKEWWVSPNWGVGFSLHYAHSSNEDGGGASSPTWETNWFGGAFSATYN
jgi:hypothetical protein